MALATLTIDMVAKMGTIEQDLGRLNHLADQSAQRLANSFDAAKASLQGFAGALGVGLSAGALVGFVKSSIDAMGALYDLSLATGATVESLSAMKLAAKLSGTTIDEVGGSIKKLAISLGDARLKGGSKAQLFEALGIDPTTVKDTVAALFELSKKLVAMPDQVKAIAVARDLLGKQASMPFIYELAAQEELIAKVSTAQALAAKKFQDDLIRLQGGAGTLGVALANSVLPAMNEILKFSLEVKKEWGLIAAILLGIGGGSVLKALGLDLDPAARAANDAAEAFTRLATARKALDQAQAATKLKDNDFIPGLADFRQGRVFSAEKEVAEAQVELRAATARRESALAKAAADSAAEKKKGKPFNLPDGILGTGRDQEASALEGLRLQLIGASEKFSELDKVIERTTNGSWKNFSVGTKATAEFLAAQIDAMKKDIELRKDREKVSGKMIEQDAKVAEQLDAARFSMREWLDGLELEAALIGNTAAQRERAQELRKIDIQLAKDLAAAEKELANRVDESGINTDLDAATAQHRALAAQRRAALLNKQGNDVTRLGDWRVGVSDALTKYQEDIANVAASTEQMVARSFAGMEDALVNFVKTGKLDFSSLADSIISDLIRIEIRQSIMKPIADSGGLRGVLGKLFGGSNSGYGDTAGVAAGVPQYAQGTPWVPNDGLAYLHKGEAVVPANMNRGGGITVNIIEDPNRAGQVQQRQSGGQNMLDVFVAQVKSSIAGDISRGSGAVPDALAGTYGLNRAAGAF